MGSVCKTYLGVHMMNTSKLVWSSYGNKFRDVYGKVLIICYGATYVWKTCLGLEKL